MYLVPWEGLDDMLRKGKRIALFGSYDWGDGDWLRSWEESCRTDGAEIAVESLKCNLTPDDAGQEACRALGTALA